MFTPDIAEIAKKLEYNAGGYINSIKQPWSQHYIVTGVGGARTDFTSQFMASQTQYFNHWPAPWTVQTLTKSSGPAQCFFVAGDPNCNINNPDVEQKLMKYYDNTAPWTVSKSHCTIRGIAGLIPSKLAHLFTIISIEIDPQSLDQAADVTWDMTYKCWLSPTMFQFPSYKNINVLAQERNYIDYNCDVSNLSKEETASIVERLVRNWYIPTLLNTQNGFAVSSGAANLDHTNLISLPYPCVRSYDGGESLSRLLGMEISNDAKATWNNNMRKAESPKASNCLGRAWSREQIYEWVQIEHQRINN
jgi:hypothetical protein